MTQQEDKLMERMTEKLLAHTGADSHARTVLQEMIGELATEVLAVKAQLSDLRILTGNQGLAIHLLDQKIHQHMVAHGDTPGGVE